MAEAGDFTEHALGNQAPSAFVDTVHTENGTYLYAVFNAGSGNNLSGCLSVSYPGTGRGIGIARAKLNGGTDRLQFMKWYGPNVAYGNPEGSFELTKSLPLTYPDPSLNCPTDFSKPRTNEGLGQDGGGLSSPILPLDPEGGYDKDDTYSFEHCMANGQLQLDVQISYVPATAEYLLTFVCRSARDPLHPHKPLSTSDASGAAWFYSTLDAT
jgi:hypothetical protein